MQELAGSAFVAAVIAALVSVVGWFVTSYQTVQLDRRRRQERMRDFQIALRAEIRSELASLTSYDLDAEYERIAAQLWAEPSGAVVLPRSAPNAIFEAILPDLHILPQEIIDPVVVYMRQHQMVDGLVEDMRSEQFSKLQVERRLAAFHDYIDLKKDQVTLAEMAIARIDESLSE